MSRRPVPLASPQSVRASVSTLGAMGIVSPPLIVTLVLPPHLVVVDAGAFGDDDGEEVDGAFELFNGRFKPREDVPCHGNGEARVDDPLILLHRPDPTLRWRFWARKRRSLPTSVESRALPVRQVLGVASRTGAPVPFMWHWGFPRIVVYFSWGWFCADCDHLVTRYSDGGFIFRPNPRD